MDVVSAGGATPVSPTSPMSARHAPNGPPKRKHSSMALDSSPGSNAGHDDDNGEPDSKKRQPGVKRACNECRQQKLRCDVVQDPFQSCSRCNRLKLSCKIESNFKRIGKRSKHAEMEKEIDRLRRNIARAQNQGYTVDEDEQDLQSPVATSVYTHTRNPSLMGSDEAVSSLLHLKRGGSYSLPRYTHELENVRLTEESVNQLFSQFFAYYHPFLPFLNPQQTPDQYFQQHALLFWSIISVAARRQDFSRVSVDLNKEQLHDRVSTWAVCNIVAQTIGTGYGQPASTLYDWTLAVRRGEDGPFRLTPELEARLQVERFCDKVSKEMYSNASDPRGVAGDEHRAMLMRVYRKDFNELQASVLSQHLGPIVNLHMRAAALHLRLAGFFDSSTTPGYIDDLMGLWRATTSFLDNILEVDKVTSPGQNSPGQILLYATNYIQQMLIAAGFALLKLMRSFFAKTIDFDRGRNLFHQTINAIRATSVVNNDLQWRLAELMVQMWNGARLDNNSTASYDNDDSPLLIDDTLQLKVRCRHSMSLVFDSVWRWREEYQAQGRGSIDANESSASSTHLDSTLMPATQGLQANSLLAANGALTPGNSGGIGSQPPSNSMLSGMSYGETNYDFFDPQHWMLDGLLDFNYNFVQPLEGA
ncbi:hypothetical protein COL516b_006442 [Colletotrichum fioriniae]|nr:uncharacterized protein COL516b_006442 [Colletotrichum fioriniae]KAJ0303439.1 hypothetical protein COL516b_006442 [Colletotrichum fioriniae]